MKKQNVLLASLLIMIVISACTQLSDSIEATETLSSQPQIIPSEDVQLTAPILPTANPQPNEELNPYSQIEQVLRSEPPCSGNKEIRKTAILDLDEYLKNESVIWDPEIIAFYESMMGNVASEINEPVERGVRIWSMYNHGFIVKTPSIVFAFDLVHGYAGWDYQLPDAILEQIQVLFISHRHGDHQDYSITRGIVDFGGEVVAPLEDKSVAFDIIYLSPDEEVTVAGLQIKAYDGLHGGLPLRIYAVTTPEGLTIMHTGDNQTSETLPDGITVDILLLNAWVNDSGSASAIIGMSNSINKLTPKLTIPGHIQELGHFYDPSSIYSRLPFEAPLSVADMSLPGEVVVQIWGEHCDFPIN